MIPTDLAARLRVLMESAVNPLAPVREVPADLPDLRAGQRFTATIQNALPDGTYRALVAGKSMTLALPQGAKSGDALELVVIGHNAKSVVAAEVAPPAQAAAPSPATAAPAATLSRTAQLIGPLMSDSDGAPAQPATISRSTPLLAEPPVAGRALAPLLQAAVSESGLFYEAHQAKWIAGQFPEAALLREPQARHAPPPAPAAAPPTAPAASQQGSTPPLADQAPETAPARPAQTDRAGSAPTPNSSPQLPANANVLARAASELETAALAGTHELPAPRASHAPTLPEDLAPLVRQQLDALAGQHVLLAGQVWPDQTLEWEIEDARRDPAANDADEQPTRWTTTLRLTLPGLGEIAATLDLDGKGVGVALRTAEPRTASTLRGAGADLARAFGEAGMNLQAMKVEHGERA